ncbi:MAG: 4-hydroxy-2-oxo-heptane-1,7-dioate aldolase, partial [Candidatus Lambdaproteobacteria bacterium]|nr:4-hydroxy-2-oxo-heptane-1,7-dioate aldolase [Candidatus Lambdaproteobacteria bacterium]
MTPNRLKHLLREGQPTCGTFLSLCSPLAAEIMGMLGFDWLLVDMEHGAGDYQTLLGQLQAIRAAGDSVPLVRVQWNDPVVVKRVLDAGAMGVMIPGVRSVAEAHQGVLATRYPPAGVRGMANVRATRFGLDPDYYAEANENIAVFMQIENGDAVRHIEDILKVPGIDV